MMFHKTLLALCFSAATVASTAPAMAANADVWVRVAPPAPRVEMVPAERRGYQWVPGHWDWRNDRYVWRQGAWVRARPGYVYRQPDWVERDGRWHRNGGQWARRDRDGDGVPNGLDRRPDNPRRN